MSKGTTIKDAIARWEAKNEKKVSEATVVKFLMQLPPIEKMDAALSQLAHVEFLALSTNCIEKIANLNGFSNLKILSLGRNNIKSLAGLEPVGDTLEQLWISYNNIEKLKGVQVLTKCKVLYMSNNKVKDWKEFQLLAEMPSLVELVFIGNPLQEAAAATGEWVPEVSKRLLTLKKLDGNPIARDDEE
eukprot:m.135939 g.135939  ORF g.135939 m.135939 type:complete len:188 (-) comp9897_c0_seq2:330-893(-)